MLKNDPLWFKTALIYEVPVRAFADSNSDGIGDFGGLTEKLDYLQELGITAVWLLPFFPSPLRDDGYDISDYTNVNPIYGTLDDFKTFLEAAHQRGIRVIIELIVNHTSDQHPWFQRSRLAAKDSPERNFYVWSDTPDQYQEARIIFKDFETSNWTWDATARAYYWHRFYSHQPDLNYDNPAVQQAVFEVLDFWLSLGVDGLRMDAVPYLYEREGTNCENLPQTHEFLKNLRRYVDEKYPNRMLLAEANQWPEDAAAYYGDGDECHMNFHFPLMPRLFMALRMEDSFPISDILQQTPPIPENCQWGLFLRNHDELTLEMVTDEDRDFMYRVYAEDPEMRVNLGIRRRLAPLLGNDRRQIELLNGLLLSLPGTPVLYYGDEIGMGDNVYVGDRNGVRTPMHWSPDRNAGFSRANPQRLYLPLIVDAEYHYNSVNVETQRANPNSLLNATKRLIATRKRFKAMGLGDFQLLRPANRKVLAFIRTYEDERILVVANLSRFVQTVELDLSSFKGQIPIEIFGRAEFPAIADSYFLSLAPYAFYWFRLQPQPSELQPQQQRVVPTLAVTEANPLARISMEFKEQLEALLPQYLSSFSWFDGRFRPVQAAHLIEAIALPYPRGSQTNLAQMICLHVDYLQGNPQTYFFFISTDEGEEAARRLSESSSSVIARLQILGSDRVVILLDAIADPTFLSFLLNTIIHHQNYRGQFGELVAVLNPAYEFLVNHPPQAEPSLMRGAHRNTSVIFSDASSGGDSAQLILKLFHRAGEGINPDLEMRQYLSQRFDHITAIAGYLEYRRPKSDITTVGILQQYIPDVRNTWNYTLDSLRDYFDVALVQRETEVIHMPQGSLLNLQRAFDENINLDDSDARVFCDPSLLSATQMCYVAGLSDLAIERVNAAQIIGTYLANVQLLGQRTAELHVALGAETNNPNFAPEPFSTLYQRSIYQYSRNLTGQVFLRLEEQLKHLPADIQPLAKMVLKNHNTYLERFHRVLGQKITAKRMRYHGDYHLGQVLYTGRDFYIIDFEGNSSRPVSERRMKRSPLRDVASMLQSFHYAANFALQQELESGFIQLEQIDRMQQWAGYWERWVSAGFLHAYLQTAMKDSFLPISEAELKVLMDFYLLERAIEDLGYELNHNLNRVKIPIQRILEFK